jgi:hypothetical protein
VIRIFTDGIVIFYSNLGAITAFLICVFGAGITANRTNPGTTISSEQKWLLSLGVGPILLALATFILAVVSQFNSSIFHPLAVLIIIFCAAVGLREFWLGIRKLKAVDRLIPIVGMGLGLILFIRLAYLRYILVPPYTDSPVHYQIIQEILVPTTSHHSILSLNNLLANYYHYGFHSMAAWLVSVSGTSPLVIMPLLGQLSLVIAVVSIMVIVQAATNNWTASLMAGLFSGIGWTMPAYAANWGKYPAMFALAVFPAYIAFISYYLIGKRNWGHIVWLLALTLGIELIHTRIVILIFLAGMSYVLARRFVVSTEMTLAQGTRIAILYGITLAPLYVTVANFYRDVPILILLILLSPFAFHYYPKPSIGIFFFSFFIELIALVQRFLPQLIPTLLNEEFIEISLYIPFSILGGFGMAGALKKVRDIRFLQWLIPAASIGVMAIHLFTGNTLITDPCCELYTEDDQVAFRWIHETVTDHSLVLTSAFNEDHQTFGTDAGIWLFPLIGVQTNKLPYDISWEATTEIQQACLAGAREIYIYMGGREFSFDNAVLSRAGWADPVFSYGNTVIYRANRC